MRSPASSPPEQRGLSRDGVRLLAATPDGLAHATFADLGRYLRAGDLLVVNTSGTIAAAVDGSRGCGHADGQLVTVHFSTPLTESSQDGDTWLVELRQNTAGRERVLDATQGETIALPAGYSLTLAYRYPESDSDRLWAASVSQQGSQETSQNASAVDDYLARYGRPIRYSYVPDPWPLATYQTVFARDPGSAEMPSAGRPFTGDLVASLIARGVSFAPITLHTGVASLEAHELPLPERFSVSEPTAHLINLARQDGRRIVAVGTTCTRAVESAADEDGVVRATSGRTDLVLGYGRAARVVNGLITGWHDPEASHLALLQAVAGSRLVAAAYAEAERADYLWHEFGDSCLLLPATGR
jgi:S-adenosylmethionine:tRNA ribosyltransferase-isomerase